MDLNVALKRGFSRGNRKPGYRDGLIDAYRL
ncbi:MAG: hypothetical protein ACJATN_001565 [Neolewinella sp.]|jgi:hypothetical protein